MKKKGYWIYGQGQLKKLGIAKILPIKNKFMKTILVATDFSKAATNAASYAADMALALNANLLLFHVYEIPIAYLEVPVIANFNDLEDTAKLETEKLKEELIERTGNKINIATQVKTGSFFFELQSTCEHVHPYMVIMGSQGTTATEHVLFGSHTIHAMKSLQWPLITVPINSTHSSVKKIGLACDLEKVIETVPIAEIKALLSDFSAELHIINTGKKGNFASDIIFQSGVLDEMLHRFNPHFHFVTNDNIDEGILDFVEKNGIDLLIALPKRHDLLNSIIHKSHTRQFIIHSHIPVMMLHK